MLPSGLLYYIKLSYLLRLFLTASDFPCFFMTLTLLRSHVGRVPFSSPHIKGRYNHHGLSLLMLTLITCLMYSVWQVCLHKIPLTLILSPILSSLEDRHHAQLTLKSRELYFLSLRAVYLHKLFGILLQGRFISFLPFIHIFNNLFISVWIHGYSFYTLGCNSILLYFVAQNFPDLAIGALQVALGSL